MGRTKGQHYFRHGTAPETAIKRSAALKDKIISTLTFVSTDLCQVQLLRQQLCGVQPTTMLPGKVGRVQIRAVQCE